MNRIEIIKKNYGMNKIEIKKIGMNRIEIKILCHRVLSSANHIRCFNEL